MKKVLRDIKLLLCSMLILGLAVALTSIEVQAVDLTDINDYEDGSSDGWLYEDGKHTLVRYETANPDNVYSVQVYIPTAQKPTRYENTDYQYNSYGVVETEYFDGSDNVKKKKTSNYILDPRKITEELVEEFDESENKVLYRYTKFNSNTGEKQNETSEEYNGNVKKGTSISYFENGNKKQENVVTYENGKRSKQDIIEYSENGEMVRKVIDTYLNGEKCKSEITVYNENGNKKSESVTTYEDGKTSNFEVINFYENGSKKQSNTHIYENGEKIKQNVINYLENGDITSKYTYIYENGEECRQESTFYNENGNKEYEYVDTFKNEEKIKTESISYWENGNVDSKCVDTYDNGMMTSSELVSYFEDSGNVSFSKSETFVNGQAISSKMIDYRQNGNKSYEETRKVISGNQVLRNCIDYDESGNVSEKIDIVEFYDGETLLYRSYNSTVTGSFIDINEDKECVNAEGSVLSVELESISIDTADFSEEAKQAISSGAKFEVVVEAKPAEPKDSTTKEKFGDLIKDNESFDEVMYFDISMYATIEGVSGKEEISDTGNEVKITIKVPDSFVGKYNNFGILRNHEGKAEILDSTYDANTKTITFSSKYFSDYAIVGRNNTRQPLQECYGPDNRVIDAIEIAANSNKIAEVFDITTLTIDDMKKLKENPTVILIMNYSYLSKDYRVLIHGKDAVVDSTIPYYGPLFLAGRYGNLGKSYEIGNTTYLIKRGDTLSKIAASNGTTVARLLALNPYIKDKNMIYSGRTLQLR